MRLLSFCLVALLLCCSTRAAWAKERAIERFALVIGNNRSLSPDVPTLRYADDDAVATHRLLSDAGVDSVLLVSLDGDSQRMFADLKSQSPARSEELGRTYSSLVARMRAARERGSEVEFLLFFSGHGDVEHGEGFVLLEDGKLTRSELFSMLLRSPATRNHVFIDACKSYFLAFDRGPGGQREPYSGAQLAESVPGRLDNTGFVLSTSSDRDSHEWERFQGGILSHELRSALRGAADTNLDGSISYAEIGAFLSNANQSIENPRFRPDFLVRPPRGNLREIVLGWKRSRASLSFQAGEWGHFYIENARGDRLLDAHPAVGQALTLWTSDERPLFVRRNDGRAESVVTERSSVQVSELKPSESALASRGALSLALDRLFELPFGHPDVEQFERAPQGYESSSAGLLPARNRHVALRWTTGAMAITAAAGGLTFSGLALLDYARSDGAPQIELERLNRHIATLNRASIACYGAAAIAGTVWAIASFWPESTVAVTPTGEDRKVGGLTFEFRGRF